jgi:Helix-turn-helix domain of resolvase
VRRIAHSGERPRAGEDKYKAGRRPLAPRAPTFAVDTEGMAREAIAAQLKISVASVYRVLRAA